MSAGPSTRIFAPGDICAIQESIAGPIRHILAYSQRFLENSIAVATGSRVSLRSHFTRDSRIARFTQIRPAVMISGASGDGRLQKVAVLATFAGTPYNELPEIIRWFAVPVAPNAMQAVPSIAMTPQWNRADAFLIAYAYPLKGTIREPWGVPTTIRDSAVRESFRVRFRMEDAASKDLTNVATKLMISWVDRCHQDSTLWDRASAEFEDWYRGCTIPV